MRYDLLSPRKKKDGGTFWQPVGVAFDRDKGGFALELNSLPLPDENGKVFVLMSEHKSREERGNEAGAAATRSPDMNTQQAQTGAQAQTPVDNDEIPFSPEWR